MSDVKRGGETERHGSRKSPAERDRAVARLTRSEEDGCPVEGPWKRVAICGGVYSNRPALEAFVADATDRGADALYCLGDLGGFGPNPEAIFSLLERSDVRCIQGNYEQALSTGDETCNCGYTDPRDNHFAEISYEYTARNCSPAFKAWMGDLPARRRVAVGAHELLLVHGSPRRVNEFLFGSTTPDAFLERVVDSEGCDGFACTHTGLPWSRRLDAGKLVLNVGALGRPANDGRTEVRYALVEDRDGRLETEILPLRYDVERLVEEMRGEGLPEEFIETVRTGWWTTCLEILPAKERAASRY